MNQEKNNNEQVQIDQNAEKPIGAIAQKECEEPKSLKNTVVEDQEHIPSTNTLNDHQADINPLKNRKMTAQKIEVDSDPDKELEKNLMFGVKNIKLTQLYCHLSTGPEKIMMVLGTIGALGGGVAGPLMAFLFGGTINDFSKNASTTGEESSINFDFQGTVDSLVNKYLYIGVGLFVAEFLNNFFWNLATLRMIHHLKEKYFARILDQEQGWFDENNAFEFSTKVGAQLEQVELGMGEKLAVIIKMVAQLISGLVIAFSTSWKLTLVMLCVAPFLLVCIFYLVTSMKKNIILSRKTYEIAGGVAEEMLYNIKTVASFANFDYENERFGYYIDRVFAYGLQIAQRMSTAVMGIVFFLNVAFFVALIYAKKLILDKDINTKTGEPFNGGDVLTVIFSTIMAIMSLDAIAPCLKIVQESTTAASDYFTLVERVPKIDLSGSYKPDRSKVLGKIEFKNINFYYPSNPLKTLVLDGLNLLFEPGKKVALVGESGCGKSTTVNLIERLYEPTSGEVLIDGVNVKNYDLNYLRSLIGYVQQEPVLFNNPIKQNIIFGRENQLKELGDPDQLIDAAITEAFAKEFIENLPDKLNYKVGIKGSKLSGGQKQRIAISRAIVCDPKILILDEATSALDNKSEKEVQKALDNISKKNVTTVIIAHRLSTIKNADLIYAIKQGHVIEQGTHEELLAKNGYYAGLVKSQLAQDELESKEENDNKLQKRKSSLSRMSRDASKHLSFGYGGKVEEVMNPESSLQKISGKSKGYSPRRIFSLLKNNKLDIFLGSFGCLINGASEPFQGYLLSKAINCLTGSREGLKDKGTFWALMFLAEAAVGGLSVKLKLWRFITIGTTLVQKMRKLILDKYLKLHISYFDYDANTPGALLTKLSLDSMQIESLVFSIIGDIVCCVGIIVTGVTMGFVFSWRLTLINLCFLPFIIASRAAVANSKRGGREDEKKINIEAGSVLSECVISTKTIYSFNFQKPAIKLYLDILEESKKVFIRDSLIKGLLSGFGVFAQYAGMATVFHYAFKFIMDGNLTFDDMNISMNCVMMTTNGIANNILGLTDYKKAKNAFNSIYNTLDTDSLIDTSKEANIHKKSAKDIKGKIEFRHVSFAYPTKPDQMILKDVSFVIEVGQSAALVGYSGCGKSTIIQLLERFYDIEEGEILIDDVNIKEYNLLELRQKIGLVSQEPVLFKRSVYENIKYGRLTATKEEVFDAAKAAAIEKFFNQQEMGTKEDPVSGGEKQRLAIARAFLKNPCILLLDEATSALDKESEKMVQESIYKLQKNRTSVTVAHRLSTIEDSDIIFVLESGKIVERGTHKELMAKNGKYAVLHKYSGTN